MIPTMKTSSLRKDGPTKTLLYAHHGFGKTHQMKHYQRHYGPGLIISGESGLKSVEDVDIDYLPFTSWDGRHDPAEGVFSLKGIVKMIHTPEFREQFNWVGLDSLTEASERCVEQLESEYEDIDNKIQMWNDNARRMIGLLKWVRDLPVHVYVSCLAKEEEDANGKTDYWPLVKGQAVSKQIPALFDHVFCGVREIEKGPEGEPIIKRSIITDEMHGWHGKTRDPENRLRVIEPGDDVTALLARLSMTKTEDGQSAE